MTSPVLTMSPVLTILTMSPVLMMSMVQQLYVCRWEFVMVQDLTSKTSRGGRPAGDIV